MTTPEATLAEVDAGAAPTDVEILRQDPKKVKELAVLSSILGTLGIVLGVALFFGSGKSAKAKAIGILSPIAGAFSLVGAASQFKRAKTANGTLLVGRGWVLIRDGGKVAVHALVRGTQVQCVVGKNQRVSLRDPQNQIAHMLNDNTFGSVELIANAVQRAVPR